MKNWNNSNNFESLKLILAFQILTGDHPGCVEAWWKPGEGQVGS
jgi:hypothetical protein